MGQFEGEVELFGGDVLPSLDVMISCMDWIIIMGSLIQHDMRLQYAAGWPTSSLAVYSTYRIISEAYTVNRVLSSGVEASTPENR